MSRNKERKIYSDGDIITLSILVVLTVISVIGSCASFTVFNKSAEAAASVTDTSSDSENKNTIDMTKYDLIQKNEFDIHRGELILVNNNNMYVFSDNDTDDYLNLYRSKADCYYISSTEMISRPNVIDPLNKMLTFFQQKSGINDINIISTYRTEETQESLYNAEVSDKGEALAKYWVALPGGSEHHTGYAVDFGIYNANDGFSSKYTGEGEYSLLNEKAPDYGFIVRYKEEKKELTSIYYEPWHFRYVGLPHSKIITYNNFCLEEYIAYLRNYTVDGKHLTYSYNGVDFEIYTCLGTDVYVPKNKKYTVSGNNIDGFIVTVRSDDIELQNVFGTKDSDSENSDTASEQYTNSEIYSSDFE